jgi:hypothetical protein
MDNVTLALDPARPDAVQEQPTYVPPAVTFEAPLEVRAGTIFPSMPDPMNLFGTNGN